MAHASGDLLASACRHPDCGCPDYDPASSDSEPPQDEHTTAGRRRTAVESAETTAVLSPLAPRTAWLLSTCGTCDHYTGWHISPIHLTSTQVIEMREREGDALEFCKAKTTEGTPCPCPNFVPRSEQGPASKVCLLCECKKGWHKYKQEDGTIHESRATVESQNTTKAQVASLPSLVPPTSVESTATQDPSTSGLLTSPPAEQVPSSSSASVKGKQVGREFDNDPATGSSSTTPSDTSSLLIPDSSDPSNVDPPSPSPCLPYSISDDVEQQDRLTAQQLQAEESEQHDLEEISRLRDLVMRQGFRWNEGSSIHDEQPLHSLASSPSTSKLPPENLAPTETHASSVQYGIAVTTPRAISNYSPDLQTNVRDVGIYSSKSMKLAVEPAIANGRTWAPGQKFDMRLKLDDSVSKADFEVLECRITATATIAINSVKPGVKSQYWTLRSATTTDTPPLQSSGAQITLDRHECVMTRVGILPVQSSSVTAPKFNERCFSWTLTLPVESTCGCRPQCPAPSTYSHSGFYVDWVLELMAKKKGMFGGKNEKLLLHLNVAAPSSSSDAQMPSLDGPSDSGSSGWKSVVKKELRYEIEGISRCIVEPRFEYRSCRTNCDDSSSPTSKTSIKIHYRISAPIVSISVFPIVAVGEPPPVPGASQQHIVRLERTAQLIKRSDLGIGVANIGCASIHQKQVVTTSPEEELVRVAADPVRRQWWQVEGYLLVPSDEMRDLRSCRAAVQFRLKVVIPFRGWVRSADALHLPQPLHQIRFDIPDIAIPPLFVNEDSSVAFDSKSNDSAWTGQSTKSAVTLTSSSGAFLHNGASGSSESKKVRTNTGENDANDTMSRTSSPPTSPSTSPSKPGRRGSFFSRLLVPNGVQELRVKSASPTLAAQVPSPAITTRNTTPYPPSSTPLHRAHSTPRNQVLENLSIATTHRLAAQERLPTFDELGVSEEGDAPPPTFEEATEEDSRYVWERIMQRLEE